VSDGKSGSLKIAAMTKLPVPVFLRIRSLD